MLALDMNSGLQDFPVEMPSAIYLSFGVIVYSLCTLGLCQI